MNPICLLATTMLQIHGFEKGQTVKVLPVDGRFILPEDFYHKNQRVFPKKALQFDFRN